MKLNELLPKELGRENGNGKLVGAGRGNRVLSECSSRKLHSLCVFQSLAVCVCVKNIYWNLYIKWRRQWQRQQQWMAFVIVVLVFDAVSVTVAFAKCEVYIYLRYMCTYVFYNRSQDAWMSAANCVGGLWTFSGPRKEPARQRTRERMWKRKEERSECCRHLAVVFYFTRRLYLTELHSGNGLDKIYI